MSRPNALLTAPRRLLLSLALVASAAACGPPDGGGPDATAADAIQGTDVAAPDDTVTDVPVTRDVAIDRALPPTDASRDAAADVAMDAPVDAIAPADVIAPIDVPADVPRAANGTCAGALALTDGVTVHGDTRGASAVAGPCGSSTSALFYSIHLPANASLAVSVTATSGAWSPYVQTGLSCNDSLCRSAGPELRFYNSYQDTSGSPVAIDLIVVVKPFGGGGGAFDLVAHVRPPADNGSCATAQLIASGAMVTDDATLGGSGMRCGVLTYSPMRYYTARVPAGSQLIATVAPAASTPDFDPAVLAATACGMSCSELASTADAGAPEAVVVPNTTNVAQDLIVGVTPGYYSSDRPGSYVLGATIVPQPYAVTRIAPSCDLALAPSLSPTTGDATSPSHQPLPFAFSYFHDAVTSYTLSENGFAQLFTAAAGSASAGDPNREFPLTEAPNGVVAPFWDTLAPAPDHTSYVGVGTFGTAPNRHVTIGWHNFAHGIDSYTRVTFQAKLFETSGVIEFHYCDLSGSSSYRYGSSATVGLENVAGTNATVLSVNQSNAVSTSAAFRLTPQ